MRLWGVHGQAQLLSSRICLLGASATGTETLKNLVLPGCGHVTIVDAALVTQADLSNNFFVSAEYLGRPRAEVRVLCAAGLPPRRQRPGGAAAGGGSADAAGSLRLPAPSQPVPLSPPHPLPPCRLR